MPNTHKIMPRPLLREDSPLPRVEKYEIVKLPDDHWRQLGKDLVLSPNVRRILLRYAKYRLKHGARGRSQGLLTISGPPGTGKSDTVRWIGDTAVRMCRRPGNGLVVNAPALFDEHLGNSQKLVTELLADVAFSAAHAPTILILDDAETLFLSREQSFAKEGDPSDVGKATTALLQGLDRLRYTANVLMFATLNLDGVVDVAVESRSDLVLSFALPDEEQRLAILGRQMKGTAGGRVLDTLATATEGWSGRRLNKLEMLAYIEGTADDPEDLTKEDYLRAVGLTPEPEGTQAAEEIVPEVVNIERQEEIEPCQRLSTNGFLGAALLQKSRSLFAWRRCNPQPTS